MGPEAERVRESRKKWHTLRDRWYKNYGLVLTTHCQKEVMTRHEIEMRI